MIKFVFLDMDDTILDFHKAEELALCATLTEFGISPTEATVRRYSEINEALWKQLELGLLTRPIVKLRRFEQLFAELGVALDADRARIFYEKRLGIGHIYLDGAQACLENLFGKYRLFIMSNGTTSVQTGRIESAGLAPYFEKIFLSEEVGSYKPDKTFFERCFAAIEGFSKSEAIILGDSLTSDIQGGINAGIRTCWFNPHAKQGNDRIRPDHEVRTHAEFEALLQRL